MSHRIGRGDKPPKKPVPGKQVINTLLAILVILLIVLAVYAAFHHGNVL